MFIEVVGAAGSKNATDRIVCMRLGEKVLLDAGSASFVPFGNLSEIDMVLLTHSHLDHILDLGFVMDSMVHLKRRPVVVTGSEACLSIVKEHYMNGLIWPDFSRISSGGTPVMEYRVMPDCVWTLLPGGVECMAVPVNHPAGARGFLFRKNGFMLVYSGDTGPTENLWKTAREQGEVSAAVIELSFPDSQRNIALAADHLSTSLAVDELAKLGSGDFPVYLFHMKPWYAGEIRNELNRFSEPPHLLKQGDRIDFL